METVRNVGGRPRVVSSDHLRKLRKAFMWGWSLSAACSFADLPRQTYYDYERRTGFRAERRLLQSWPELLARRNVSMAIEAGDADLSKWFLSRRCDDFVGKVTIGMDAHQESSEEAAVAILVGLIELSKRRAEGATPAEA